MSAGVDRCWQVSVFSDWWSLGTYERFPNSTPLKHPFIVPSSPSTYPIPSPLQSHPAPLSTPFPASFYPIPSSLPTLSPAPFYPLPLASLMLLTTSLEVLSFSAFLLPFQQITGLGDSFLVSNSNKTASQFVWLCILFFIFFGQTRVFVTGFDVLYK